MKFLVHFIGDVHQSLHAGFVSDDDGLTIQGKSMSIIDLLEYIYSYLGFFFDKTTTLHDLWDTL